MPTTLPPHCEQLLSPEENLRWRRYRQPTHRNRFLIGKTLQRMVLSAYLPIAPSSWRFVHKPLGRPEVGAPSAGRRLRFSLSHTTGLCALAVTLDRDLGMDVEHEGISLTSNLVNFALSSAECAVRSQHQAENCRDPFFDFWTLKEAYLKAQGIGLSFALSSISFTLLDNGRAALTASPKLPKPDEWQFMRLRPTEKHQLSVAVACSAEPLSIVLHNAMSVVRWND